MPCFIRLFCFFVVCRWVHDEFNDENLEITDERNVIFCEKEFVK